MTSPKTWRGEIQMRAAARAARSQQIIKKEKADEPYAVDLFCDCRPLAGSSFRRLCRPDFLIVDIDGDALSVLLLCELYGLFQGRKIPDQFALRTSPGNSACLQT